jgi:SAM-dependent methyltransferase
MSNTEPRFLARDPEQYEHFMGRWSRRLAGPFLDFSGIGGGDRVLDVGCGTGVLTAALAERGSKAVGIDGSEAYLASARRNRPHPNVPMNSVMYATYLIAMLHLTPASPPWSWTSSRSSIRSFGRCVASPAQAES